MAPYFHPSSRAVRLCVQGAVYGSILLPTMLIRCELFMEEMFLSFLSTLGYWVHLIASQTHKYTSLEPQFPLRRAKGGALALRRPKVRVRCLVFCCALADGSGSLMIPRRLCLIQVGRLAILAGFLTLWIFLIQARVAVAHFWRWWVMIVSSRPVAARLPVWCAVRPPSAPLGLTL